MVICKNEKYNKIKRFIYEQCLNNIQNMDSIISLFDSLEKKDKEKFLKELMKKGNFNKSEFYSREKNNKLNLIYAFYEKKKIIKVPGDTEKILTGIINDLDKKINS